MERFGAWLKQIWAWLAANHQSLSVTIASISLTVAAISATVSIFLNLGDQDYRLKKETLAFFLQYSPATQIRGVIAKDPRLLKYFQTESPIPAEIVQDIINDGDGTDDATLRTAIIDLVNYNEMLCMGRQKRILDPQMFDLQFQEILKADFRVLKYFMAYTVQKQDASYPFWADALQEWGLSPSDLRK